MSNIEKHNNKLAKKLTQQEFLKEFNVPNCLEKFNKVNSSIQAFKTEVKTLASIKKEYSKKFVLAYIKVWIINLNDFLNVKRKMTPEQIDETSIFIFNDYYYLNIADINLVFTRIKKGYYGDGKLYESIDGMKIIDFFVQYNNERSNNISHQLDTLDSKHKSTDHKRTSGSIRTILKK